MKDLGWEGYLEVSSRAPDQVSTPKLDQAAQGLVQTHFEHVQGWRCHHCCPRAAPLTTQPEPHRCCKFTHLLSTRRAGYLQGKGKGEEKEAKPAEKESSQTSSRCLHMAENRGLGQVSSQGAGGGVSPSLPEGTLVINIPKRSLAPSMAMGEQCCFCWSCQGRASFCCTWLWLQHWSH